MSEYVESGAFLLEAVYSLLFEGIVLPDDYYYLYRWNLQETADADTTEIHLCLSADL